MPDRFQTGNPFLPLTENECSRLYWEISRRGGFCSGEKRKWRYGPLPLENLLTLAILQSRYDPRLTAVLVDFFCRSRFRLNPLRLKEGLKGQEALPAAAAIGEFVLRSQASPEAKELFRYLMAGTRPVPTQLYYRGLYPLGGRKMEEVVDRPLRPFRKWGFLAAEPPRIKERPGRNGTYLWDRRSRFRILGELARERGFFRLRDYLDRVDRSISRQQALQDLLDSRLVRKTGRGKGTRYTPKKTATFS